MTRDTIQSIDQQWNVAYQTNYHASLAQILADEWTAIDARGKRVTKAAILDQVAHFSWPLADARFQTISIWQGNDVAAVRQTDAFREDYIPHVVRDAETRDSLLNLCVFEDPFD